MNPLTSAEIRAMRAQAMNDGAGVFWPIAEAVASEFGVSLREISSLTRGTERAAMARAWACRCAYDRGLTMASIARLLRRDHSSVSDAIAKTRAAEPVLIFKSRRAS